MNGNIFKMIEHRQSPTHARISVLDDRVAAEIMTAKVLLADSDWTLSRLTSFFKEHKISGAPVNDSTGRLVGVVSLTDILIAQQLNGGSHSANNLDYLQLNVADIMTHNVKVVTMNTPLFKVANLMVTNNIHRVMVAHDKKIVGIISSLDMLRQEIS